MPEAEEQQQQQQQQQQDQQQQDEQQQQQQQPPAVADWLKGLPETYHADPDLTRMASVEDLAKGYTETRKWAKGRVPIPTDEAGFRELGEKLRPENAEGYKIDVPEGDSGELAKGFAQFAFDTGIPAPWAEGTAKWFNQQQAEALGKIEQTNNDEIKAVELEYGPAGFNVRVEAVNNMLAAAGIEDFDVATGLQTALGADGKPTGGKVLRSLMTLAERYGELQKVDGVAVDLRMGTLTPGQAQAEADRMLKAPDPDGKLRDKNSAEFKKLQQLQARAAEG